MQEILPYIIAHLGKFKIRHEVHKFDSGALMVDVWLGNDFYCIQIDAISIGLSLVTPENSFDTIPDTLFKKPNEFKDVFEKLIDTLNSQKSK